MSPKSKLGRNPFEATARTKAKSGVVEGAGASSRDAKRQRIPRERAYRKPRRRHPPGFAELLKELTHYWVPRVRACLYVRAVKTFSRFA